ncbi:MAG: hypothetical protein IKJ56_07595, partial [Bacteroidales bacterium]|nr:hypothetical protein [Bacteroidales bacterium]
MNYSILSISPEKQALPQSECNCKNIKTSSADAFKTRPYVFLVLFFVSILSFNYSLLNAQETPFPTDHLQLWLRADSVELTDGKVSRWYDLSPNQYEIVQNVENARPFLTESAINNLPALQFNGTSTFLDGGDILDLETESWTWVIVGMPTNSNSWASFFSKADRNATSGRYSLSTKTLYYFINLSNYYEISIPS